MRSLRAALRRLIASFRRHTDIADELDAHLQLQIDDNLRAGMTTEEARRQALLSLGGLSSTIESYRDRRNLPFVETTMQDVRYALRLLWKSPGYTLAAVAALAIGIGANTAVFSVVNGVLLKAFPYRNPEQLVLLFEQLPNAPAKFGFSPPDFEFFRKTARSYAGVAAFTNVGYELSSTSTPLRIKGARVSPELFSVLSAAPAAGRVLTRADDDQRARVAVISGGLWARTFGRDPSIVGRTISLDGQTYTVVGAMSEQFQFPPRGARFNGEPADVFVPMSYTPNERQGYGMFYNSTVVGRLNPGVSIAQAVAEIPTLAAPMLEQYPAALRPFTKGLTVPISPLFEETVGSSRQLLLILMGAVALVLLIGCADVAGLILTRSASRQRELAIRSALGATGGRIARQLLTESFVLAAAGSAAGLAMAYGLMQSLVALAGDKLPRTESIAFDSRIVLFAVAMAIVTPLFFGVVPALRAVRGTGGDALKDNAHSLASGRRRSWLLGSIVVGQVAIALVLAVGAGLLVRSFVRLLQTDVGFRTERTVRATATLPAGRYAPPKVRPFYQQLMDGARAIPGVTAIGAGTDVPLSVRERRAFSADASSRPIPQNSRLVAPTWTAGAYFEALGIPLKRGRFFTDADGPDALRVAIVNERLARLVWPDTDPIGHQVRWGVDIPQNQSPWMTIVGVVADVKQAGLDVPAMAQIYVPVAQDATGGPLFRTPNLIVRSNRSAESIVGEVRAITQRLDGELPVTTQTLDEMVGDSVKPQRFSMTLMMAFAGLALMLAALGIYGVLANAVAQQTQEIGVRVALGATTFDVMWMVLSRALTLVVVGLTIGAAGAAAVTRTMTGLLFEIRPTDVTSFVGATVALTAVALVASLLPAWRATRVDPIIALRAE
jgi:predicted permease